MNINYLQVVSEIKPPLCRNNNIGVSDYAYTMYVSRAGEEEKEE